MNTARHHGYRASQAKSESLPPPTSPRSVGTTVPGNPPGTVSRHLDERFCGPKITLSAPFTDHKTTPVSGDVTAEIGEAGELGQEGHPDGAGCPGPVLGHDHLGQTLVLLILGVVVLVPIDEHHDVGVLFQAVVGHDS